MNEAVWKIERKEREWKRQRGGEERKGDERGIRKGGPRGRGGGIKKGGFVVSILNYYYNSLYIINYGGKLQINGK